MPAGEGRIMAVSLYFYATSAAKDIMKGTDAALKGWPSPSVGDLRKTVKGFCGTEYSKLEVVAKKVKQTFQLDER